MSVIEDLVSILREDDANWWRSFTSGEFIAIFLSLSRSHNSEFMKLFSLNYERRWESLVCIDFPAIAFTHIWNYHFIVKLMRFSFNKYESIIVSYHKSIKILLARIYFISHKSKRKEDVNIFYYSCISFYCINNRHLCQNRFSFDAVFCFLKDSQSLYQMRLEWIKTK